MPALFPLQETLQAENRCNEFLASSGSRNMPALFPLQETLQAENRCNEFLAL
jgi:hypothetical protein